MNCEVCKEDKVMTVCSSRMGAVSHAYCSSCYGAGAEPWTVIVATAFCIGDGSLESFSPSYREIIRSTMDILGKTENDLILDVVKAQADYAKYVEKLEEE